MDKWNRAAMIFSAFSFTACFIMLVWLYFNDDARFTNTGIGHDESAVEWAGKQETANGNADVVYTAIPCETKLYLKADRIEQKTNFYNPEENDCYIRFTLLIDGDEVWQSGYCPPGMGYYDIELNRTIPKGAYNGTLRYECFTDNKTELNGAEMQLEIVAS